MVVVRATAVGLGVGEGGGHSWSGGVQLESSEDMEEWEVVAECQGSDTVRVGQQEKGSRYWRVSNLDDCGWRPAVTALRVFTEVRSMLV